MGHPLPKLECPNGIELIPNKKPTDQLPEKVFGGTIQFRGHGLYMTPVFNKFQELLM